MSDKIKLSQQNVDLIKNLMSKKQMIEQSIKLLLQGIINQYGDANSEYELTDDMEFLVKKQ